MDGNNMKHEQIVNWLDNTPPKRQKHRSKHFSFLLITFIIGCCFVASAGLLSYYARINSDIQVLPVILVDGETNPSITDTFTAMAGSTINITHNVTNLNENNSIPVRFNITSIDEGLTVIVWTVTNPPFQDITYNNCLCSANLDSLQTFEFNISYYISPYANPEENLISTVQVEYDNF